MINTAYLVALHSVDGLGPIRLKKLLDVYGDPKKVWEEDEKELSKLRIPENIVQNLKLIKKSLDPEDYYIRLTKAGVGVVTIYDQIYPSLLKQIYDPPIILFFKGDLEVLKSNCIGVVGSRKMTGYGKIVTEKLTKELVESGFVIVSGLARGVDTTAHKMTIESNGKTIAVLGGGIENIFPPENQQLAEKISNGFGILISEFPPQYPSLPGNFPSRNRIISGLSKAVLVTEAAEDSGSLITANLAAEYGREVFAVPGPITSTLSKGPFNLIKQGATLVYEAKDILEVLGIDSQKKIRKDVKIDLSEIDEMILNNLENESKHIDELCRDLKIDAAKISSGLLKMEIAGYVKSLGSGVYIKC